MLTVVSMGRSESPTATPDPTDLRLNLTTETDPSRPRRKYYVLKLRPANNPMAAIKTRVITQDYNSQGLPVWRRGDPNLVQQFVGKELPGEVFRAPVKKYFVPSLSGKVELLHNGNVIKGNYAHFYETVCFPHEDPKKIFADQGLEIVPEAEEQAYTIRERKIIAPTPVAQPATPATPAATPNPANVLVEPGN